MRKKIMGIAVFAVSFLLMIGIITVPGRSVNADQDAEIKLGQTVATDLSKDSVWWLKYDAKQAKMVRIDTSGLVSAGIHLYKDSKDGTLIGDAKYYTYYPESEPPFIKYLEKGTYYLEIEPLFSSSGTANDTKVTLTDITDTTLVADINESTFPDVNFRNFVIDNYDLRKDNKLTSDEILAATRISIKNDIASFKGIEYFSELYYFNSERNKITELDLSKNKKINTIYCDRNDQLMSLDVSGCKSLEELDCSSNGNLATLKLSGCTALYSLTCNNTLLTELDLRNLSALNTVNCYNCKLTSIKVAGCKKLDTLICYNNANITSLDLTSITDFRKLDCNSNNISNLKVNNKIEYLDCSNNQINKLDITGRERLSYLKCSNNSDLTDLSISGCAYLEAIFIPKYSNTEGTVYSRKIDSTTEWRLEIDPATTVTVSDTPAKKVVQVIGTEFPDDDFRDVISGYDMNGDGWLDENEIKTIKELRLESMGITNISGLKWLSELEELDIDGNKIDQIDLSNCKKLTRLECAGNALTKLDVSNLKELIYLDCSGNKIQSLDVSNNNKLMIFLAHSNNLSSIDIKNNKELMIFSVYDNKIKKLDITENPLLLKAFSEGSQTINTINGKEYVAYGFISLKGLIFVEFAYDKNTTLVTEKPVSLTLNKKEANVVCGATLTLKATLKNSTSAISWKSSNTKIATVDSKGKITAKMAGKVTITASAAGKTAKCTVTVLYKDVTNSSDFWYAPTNYLTAKGVVKGYANQTEFRPANECTRAQMVTFLYRLQGEPKTKSNECKFDDVKSGDYFYKPVIWAVEQGITTGVSATKFEPQKVCTRAQTVTFLWRMAGKPEPGKNAKTFSDVKKTDYFYKATLWASGMKILAGYDDGTFKPQGKCLRRQMVTFLYKYDKYVNGKG